MEEQALYAMLGRKQAQVESQDAAYTQLLELLAGVVGGSIEPSRLLVNLTDRTWQMVPQGQRPSMPSTLNGRPVCVVAPQGADDVEPPTPEMVERMRLSRLVANGERIED